MTGRSRSCSAALAMAAMALGLFVSVPIVTFAALPPEAREPAAPSGPAPQHEKWLDLVGYIIEEDEKRLFEGLQAAWQRERFIEAFWQRRDPVPVTPENEFRAEYMRRWEYVNDVLARDTPVPGWRTDRGRVYLVNGPPFKILPYPNTQQLYPLEIWEYRDTPRLGMPGFYQIIFFKPRVFNEWRLYSPAVDGPEALIIANPSNISNIDLPQLATKFPMVFTAAQRVAPGYDVLGSEAVIARTMAPPKPPRPLSLFYRPEGAVDSTFLSAGPIDFDIQANGFVHAELEGYVDIAIEVPYTAGTFIELEVETTDAGTWRDSAGSLVVRIPKEDFYRVDGLPILHRQRLWLLPGTYKVRALLTEVATNHVGAAEAMATIPERKGLVVGSPSLFYATEEKAPSGGRGDWRVALPLVDSRLRLGASVGCVVRVINYGVDGLNALDDLEIEYLLWQEGEIAWRDSWRGAPAARRDDESWMIARKLHVEALPPGRYELEIRARRRSSEAGEPVVAPTERRPIELVDEFMPVARLLSLPAGVATFAEAHHQLGQQLLRRNDFERAQEHFAAAVRLESDNATFQIDAAKTLVLAGDLATAEFFLSRATTREPDNQEGWATLGLLRLQQQNFAGAVEAYQTALDVAPGTPAVYNGLAEAFLSNGQMPEALEMLELSLEINPSQQQVRQLVDRLKSGDLGPQSEDAEHPEHPEDGV